MFQGVLASGMGMCSDALISSVCSPSLSFLNGPGLLTATYLSICILNSYLFIYCAILKPFMRVRTAYVKWKGVLYFSLKGGTSLSEEKKAGCTRLAGSDRSQRRFACCHSQRKNATSA